MNKEGELGALAKRFKPGGADHILRTYLNLHASTGKIVGEHWLWCALEQIAAGQPEHRVMASYGYTHAEQPMPPNYNSVA